MQAESRFPDVTARTAEYLLGWRVLYYDKQGYNHYFNYAPSGSEVDFCSDQFAGDGLFPIALMLGFGIFRKFKPVRESKALNPRLKLYLDRLIW